VSSEPRTFGLFSKGCAGRFRRKKQPVLHVSFSGQDVALFDQNFEQVAIPDSLEGLPRRLQHIEILLPLQIFLFAVATLITVEASKRSLDGPPKTILRLAVEIKLPPSLRSYPTAR
jgi:hypothetical protein